MAVEELMAINRMETAGDEGKKRVLEPGEKLRVAYRDK